jgi:hypothetical protein
VQVETANAVIFKISISLKSILRTQTYQPLRLNVFENRVLRRIFGPKRDEVTGEWKNLHKEELNDLYGSLNIVRGIKSKRMRWAGHVARVRTRTGEYSVLVGKSEGKRSLGKLRRRWKER